MMYKIYMKGSQVALIASAYISYIYILLAVGGASPKCVIISEHRSFVNACTRSGCSVRTH